MGTQNFTAPGCEHCVKPWVIRANGKKAARGEITITAGTYITRGIFNR